MPKRKRGEEHAKVGRYPRNAVPQEQHIEDKIKLAKTSLFRAIKSAKGFERQRLSKRHREHEQAGDASGVERVDAEIVALKTLDLTSTAHSYVHKSLLKIKSIRESPLLPVHVKETTRSIPAGPVADVMARLYNSKPVKNIMPEIIGIIRAAMGISDTLNKKRKTVVKTARADSVEDAASMIERDESRNVRHDILEDVSLSSEDHDDRLASPGFSDSSFSDFDTNFGQTDTAVPTNASEIPTYDPTRDLSLSPTPTPSLTPPPETKSTSRNIPTNAKSRIEFLPSLTMGGYISGSDSDFSDYETPAIPAPRKNRRGQRARQQIWEKKFGKRAKHMQGADVPEKSGGRGRADRDEGWDMKRGAASSSARARDNKKGGPHRSSGRGPAVSGENAIEVSGSRLGRDDASKKAVGNQPLHPSWEAAKKAKEMRQAGNEAMKPAGKKIVFD